MRGMARGTARGRTRRNERSRRIGDGMASSRFGLRSLTAALLMLLLVAGSVSLAGAALADPSPGSMHVVVPTPSNDGKTVQGPVGTNVSVSAGQATANATYTLGWVPQASGCAGQITPFTDTPSVTADDGGNFTATFAWPDAAGTPGALYLICASDATNGADVFAADQAFQVLAASAPAITLAQAPSSTAHGDTFNAGGPVQINGSNFMPPGTQVAFFVTPRATFAAQDYQPDNALKTEDGSQATSDGQGQFTAIVTLPKLITGQLFLHAVSTDAVTNGQGGFPPSLSATSNIQLAAPKATPTVQPSPTPKAAHTPAPAPPKANHTKRIVAIAGLGFLSVVLFILGGILIASAAIGPRTPTRFDSDTRAQRAQPTGVHSDQGW